MKVNKGGQVIVTFSMGHSGASTLGNIESKNLFISSTTLGLYLETQTSDTLSFVLPIQFISLPFSENSRT